LSAPEPPRSRRERALDTRRRVLRAAYDRFQQHGYAGATMEAIASAAGVAVQTLYFTFHTKAALLDEVVGAAVTGFEEWQPPAGGRPPLELDSPRVLREFHPWFASFEAEATASGALAVFLGAGVEIMERAAPMTTVMREAAGHPDAREVYLVGEQRRAGAYRAVIRVLARKPPGRRRGLSEARATDILLTLFSGETYQMLRERGWTQRQILAWLLDVLGHQRLAG